MVFDEFPETIGGLFDFLDDDVEFNGTSYSIEDIVYFGSSSDIGIATINAQGSFVSVVEGNTSAYLVVGAFANVAGEPFQPDFSPTAEAYFATQYIENGIGLFGDLEDYFDALGDVNAGLVFDAGSKLGIGNAINYQDVEDLFIVTTQDTIDVLPPAIDA